MFRTLVKSLCSAVCLLLTLTAVPAQVDPPLYRSPTQYPGFPGLSHGAVVSADFNGDGHPDLAVVDFALTDNVEVFLNQGGGRFAHSQTLTVGIGMIGGLLSMETADFNGDHRPDLLVTDEFRGVRVLVGRGDGTFTQGGLLPIPPPIPVSEGIAVGDVNHDRTIS